MDRKIQDIYFIFADMHLGEGKNNNLEYFEEDEKYCAAIRLIMEQHRGEPITLCQLGDTFDFLAVEYNGKTRAEPTEEAAVEQIEKIFAAHPKVIDVWRLWLANGGKIKFFIGNHDLALSWVNVKNFICRELTKDWAWHYDPDPTKCVFFNSINSWNQIEFLLEEKKNGAYFTHGNNAESLHATPKNVFLTKRMGKPLLLPLLRHPYGNHSRTDLANPMARGSRICKGNYWIGRLEPHWYVYLEAIWKNRWFAINALILWLIMPIRHRLSRRWWVRKSAGLVKLFLLNLEALLLTLWDTFRGRGYTYYPKNILKDNDDIDAVFLGHIHTCRREMHEKYGTFIYPGNWSVTYDVQFPKPEIKWKRFRRLERVIKTIWATRKMFRKKDGLYEPKRRKIYSFGVCRFYGDGYKEVNLMRLNPEKNCLEELN